MPKVKLEQEQPSDPEDRIEENVVNEEVTELPGAITC